MIVLQQSVAPVIEQTITVQHDKRLRVVTRPLCNKQGHYQKTCQLRFQSQIPSTRDTLNDLVKVPETESMKSLQIGHRTLSQTTN